jgi:outer membrane receptor protein involved in Fe transport
MTELNWRKRLVASSVLAGAFASMVAPTAFSQTAEEETVETVTPEAEVDGEARQETIMVTGSRIGRTGTELTQPTEIVNADFIEIRSLTNAADAVTQIPGVVGIGPRLANNTGAGDSGVGQNVVSLFNLGSQRTLTLFDGRRFVSSVSPTGAAVAPGSQVDVNNLPLGLVDRVEVVKVGGAAVYGADAVAGVVNYVLKRDYEGAEISADYRTFGGSPFENYAEEYSVRGLLGGNFDNDRGNIVLAFEFNDLPTIARADVPSRNEQWSSFTPVGDNRVLRDDGSFPGNQVRLIPNPRAGLLSTGGLITPGPTAVTNVGTGQWGPLQFIQFNEAGEVVPFDRGIPTGSPVWASGGDGLDLGLTNTTQEGYQRYNTAILGTYQLTPDINFKTTIFRNRTSSSNPGFQTWYSSGAFGGTQAGLVFNTNNPWLSAASADAIEAAAVQSLARCQTLSSVAPATPVGALSPRQICVNQSTPNADGSSNFTLQKAWLDLGARRVTNENNVESYHFGFDGDFGALGRDFGWELNYQLGRSTIASSRSEPSTHRWFAAMDVGINPTTNQLDCRFNYEAGYDAALRAQFPGVTATESLLGIRGTCVPFNPFATASQAAVDYIAVNLTSFAEIEQEIVSGYLSTDSMFTLPAGDVGLAVGFENRSESSSSRVDGTTRLGTTPNGIGESASGSYRTWDLYAETLIPIVSEQNNIPFIQDLNIEASYRKLESDRSGNDEAWATGVNFVPIPDIRFRANYAKTVRAPAVRELFLPASLTSQFGADPCDAALLSNGPRPATRAANCAAEGIPTSFVSLARNASRRGTTGGNENLANEQAVSVNFGVVIQPRFIDGLTISADYTKIDITDAITTFTLTNIMEACYDGTDFPNRFCGQFVRGPDFQLPAIDAFTSGFVNAALREFDVVEVSTRYTNEVGAVPLIGQLAGGRDLGTFDILARGYNVQTDTTSNTGVDRNDLVGQWDNPKWVGDITLSHNIDRLTTFVDLTYTGSGVRSVFQNDPLQFIDEGGQPYTNVDSIWLMDIGATYDVTDTISLRANVTNVTDWYPDPVEISLGRGTFGRVWTIGATARF